MVYPSEVQAIQNYEVKLKKKKKKLKNTRFVLNRKQKSVIVQLKGLSRTLMF